MSKSIIYLDEFFDNEKDLRNIFSLIDFADFSFTTSDRVLKLSKEEVV
jgi:hypothetical protein